MSNIRDTNLYSNLYAKIVQKLRVTIYMIIVIIHMKIMTIHVIGRVVNCHVGFGAQIDVPNIIDIYIYNTNSISKYKIIGA